MQDKQQEPGQGDMGKKGGPDDVGKKGGAPVEPVIEGPTDAPKRQGGDTRLPPA